MLKQPEKQKATRQIGRSDARQEQRRWRLRLKQNNFLDTLQAEPIIGAGGMGEVYKATDTRLDRTVAIKVPPEHVAQDPDLKQRFEREARTVASVIRQELT